MSGAELVLESCQLVILGLIGWALWQINDNLGVLVVRGATTRADSVKFK